MAFAVKSVWVHGLSRFRDVRGPTRRAPTDTKSDSTALRILKTKTVTRIFSGILLCFFGFLGILF